MMWLQAEEVEEGTKEAARRKAEAMEAEASERNTTCSPSSGSGEFSVSGGMRTLTYDTWGSRRVWRRNPRLSSWTLEQS